MKINRTLALLVTVVFTASTLGWGAPELFAPPAASNLPCRQAGLRPVAAAERPTTIETRVAARLGVASSKVYAMTRRHRNLFRGERAQQQAGGFRGRVVEPYFPDPERNIERFIKAGQETDALQRLAIVIGAGGEGSRIIADYVKDLVQKRVIAPQEAEQYMQRLTKVTLPVTPVTQLGTLGVELEVISEICQKTGVDIPVIVAVSPLENNEPNIKQFLKEHNNFGIKNKNLRLCVQGLNPAYEAGKQRIAVKADGTPVLKPNGIGGIFEAMIEQGHIKWLRDLFAARGIKAADARLLYLNGDNLIDEGLVYIAAGAGMTLDATYINFSYDLPKGGPQGVWCWVQRPGQKPGLEIIEQSQIDSIEWLREMLTDSQAALQANGNIMMVSLVEDSPYSIESTVGQLPEQPLLDKRALGVSAGNVDMVEKWITDLPRFHEKTALVSVGQFEGMKVLADLGTRGRDFLAGQKKKAEALGLPITVAYGGDLEFQRGFDPSQFDLEGFPAVTISRGEALYIQADGLVQISRKGGWADLVTLNRKSDYIAAAADLSLPEQDILSDENLSAVAANIGPWAEFVRQERAKEKYLLVSFQGGSGGFVQGQAARLQGLPFAAIACSSDNGGLDAAMRWELFKKFGHTIPCGDITNAIKGMLCDWGRWIYDTRGWELTDETFHDEPVFDDGEKQAYRERVRKLKTFTERVRFTIKTYETKMNSQALRVPATKDFVQFKREIINLAKLVDKYNILNAAHGSALNIDNASIRHATFYALMIKLGAYDEQRFRSMVAMGRYKEKRHAIDDERRFMAGLYFLQKGFGLPYRVAVPSVAPMVLRAKWLKNPDGDPNNPDNIACERTGEVNISTTPDAPGVLLNLGADEIARVSTLATLDLQTHPDLIKKVTPYHEALEILDQVEDGGLVVLGPSDFVVSLCPSVKLLAEKLMELKKRGVRIVLVLNNTYNNDTLSFEKRGAKGFLDYLKRILRDEFPDIKVADILDYVVANTDVGELDVRLRAALADRIHLYKDDPLLVYKQRGPLTITEREARDIEAGYKVKVIGRPLVEVVERLRKGRPGTPEVIRTPWAAHRPEALGDIYWDILLESNPGYTMRVLKAILTDPLELRAREGPPVRLAFLDLDKVLTHETDANVSHQILEWIHKFLAVNEATELFVVSSRHNSTIKARFDLRHIEKKGFVPREAARLKFLGRLGADKLGHFIRERSRGKKFSMWELDRAIRKIAPRIPAYQKDPTAPVSGLDTSGKFVWKVGPGSQVHDASMKARNPDMKIGSRGDFDFYVDDRGTYAIITVYRSRDKAPAGEERDNYDPRRAVIKKLRRMFPKADITYSGYGSIQLSWISKADIIDYFISEGYNPAQIGFIDDEGLPDETGREALVRAAQLGANAVLAGPGDPTLPEGVIQCARRGPDVVSRYLEIQICKWLPEPIRALSDAELMAVIRGVNQDNVTAHEVVAMLKQSYPDDFVALQQAVGTRYDIPMKTRLTVSGVQARPVLRIKACLRPVSAEAAI